MKVSRSRTVQASPEAIWRLVSDPHHLPRWWPRVTRVEGVSADAWTTVYGTGRGRTVRGDYTLVGEEGRRRTWSLEAEGTPFERLFTEQLTTVEVHEGKVTLEVRQSARGWARFGGFSVRRGTARTLDEALAGIVGAVEEGA
jgi:uncharacterized protein YndB with AHSA1/START domain